jgi:hypothetical protein
VRRAVASGLPGKSVNYERIEDLCAGWTHFVFLRRRVLTIDRVLRLPIEGQHRSHDDFISGHICALGDQMERGQPVDRGRVGAVDAMFRGCAVVSLPGYSRPLILVRD